jgi:hypothetical protein
MTIFEAYAQDKLVELPDGTVCKIYRIKDGKAKIRTLTKDGKIMQAWVWLEQLKVKA